MTTSEGAEMDARLGHHKDWLKSIQEHPNMSKLDLAAAVKLIIDGVTDELSLLRLRRHGFVTGDESTGEVTLHMPRRRRK